MWFHYIICRCRLGTIEHASLFWYRLSFFVCDNSTTGHICKDIWKFVQGTIWQTNKSLTTANGTGSWLQEGTVKIRLINDAGTEHIFILDSCLYHPNSPVNLLSTRQLAEKFLDANGNLDEETCIKSRYLTHVLTWSFGQFKKTFSTPLSGLPEVLFDKGFARTNHFACKLILHMSIQLQIWHLRQANLQTLSLLEVKNCLLTPLMMLTMMLLTCYSCFMRISFWKTAKESHEKSCTLVPSIWMRSFSTKLETEIGLIFLLKALSYLL